MVVIGALGALYSYFLYPLLLRIFPDAAEVAGNSRPRPPMTLIIAARNEERRIRDKLKESVALREVYAPLEIIVASDASTDRTDEIVAEFADRGVRLVRTAERNGKEFAQRSAIDAASGDIIAFTDAATHIVPESLPRIAMLLEDAAVGAVSSTDRMISADGSTSGEGFYIRYEMWLRSLESRKGGLIGLSGSFFAARRRVCQTWDTDIPSDFAVAINSRLLGLRAVSDSAVIGEYRDAGNRREEFARKVRTVIRGMSALARKKQALDPFRFGQFAFQLWSHKVMRWAVPWFALLYTAGAAWGLMYSPFYWLALAPALLVAVTAVFGAAAIARGVASPLSTLYYFVQANAAVMSAGIQFACGRRVRTWDPTKR